MTPAIAAWIARDPASRRIEGPSVARFLIWQTSGAALSTECCVLVMRLADCADADAVHGAMVAAARQGLRAELGEAERELRIAKANLAHIDQRAAWLAGQR